MFEGSVAGVVFPGYLWFGVWCFCEENTGHPSFCRLYLALSRSSSREIRIRVPFFQDVYFSGGTLPQKGREGHLAGGPSCLVFEGTASLQKSF